MIDSDMFELEYESFQWDVHLLVIGALQAGIHYLGSETETEVAKIDDWIANHGSSDRVVDERIDLLATTSAQQRFLRNMALVALASRLIHSLRAMARWAETFSPRRPGRYEGSSEFERLLTEYTERFGIKFVVNGSRINFVKPMVDVRNQIVHDGAEANTIKPFEKMSGDRATDGDILDMTFSERYPEYVEGSGIGAVVSVSKEQLDGTIKAATQLVAWLAAELRKRELANAKDTTNIH